MLKCLERKHLGKKRAYGPRIRGKPLRDRVIMAAGAVAVSSLAAEYGLRSAGGLLGVVDQALVVLFAALLLWAALSTRRPAALWPAVLVMAVVMLRPLVEARYSDADPATAARLLDVLRVTWVVRVYLAAAGAAEVWRWVGAPLLRAMLCYPVRTALVAYAAFIALAFAALSLPGVFYPSLTVSRVDIAMLSVSAVTLTGVTPINIADTMSRMGQAVLITIVQIGAVLIMVVGAGFWLAVRRPAIDASVDDAVKELGTVLRVIVVTTIAIEAIGTLLLFWRLPVAEFSTYTRVFIAGFHAVSAYCHAGFSVYARGMAPFYADWDIGLIVSTLTLVSSLGFFVFLAAIGRREGRTQTGLILFVTSGLVLIGAIATMWYATHGGASLLEGVFHSVATRSSGFSLRANADYGAGVALVASALMLAGGAPGSPAGGIKVTAVGLLLGALASRRVRAYRPELTAAVAAALVTAFAVVLGGVLLWLVEAASIRALLLEAVSAFGTVGFSQAQTARYSIPGKLIVMSLMMLGRVLPMIVGLVIYRRARRPPDGTLMIG